MVRSHRSAVDMMTSLSLSVLVAIGVGRRITEKKEMKESELG
jgi:hypothetical protein